LRTLLLAVLVAILLLPVGGIGALRLYDTELIRRTEAELIGQGAFIAQNYRAAVAAELRARGKLAGDFGVVSTVGDAVSTGARLPTLDRATSPILPPAPDAIAHEGGPDPIALAAGARIADQLVAGTRITLSGVRIIGPDGFVVCTSRRGQGDWLGHRREVAAGLAGRPLSLLRQRRTDNVRPPLESLSRGTLVRVFVAMPVVVQGRVWGAVILSRTPMDVLKALFLNRFRLVGGALALLAVVMAVALLTSRRIARPLDRLVALARRVASGERGVEVALDRPGTREHAELAAAIADMAAALQARAAHLQAFASHVSHAFKTPLTSIRGTVELLQDHLDTMAPADRERFLGNLDADTERLATLAQRLLVLARADVLQPGAARCDAADVIRRACEDPVAVAETVTVRAEPADAPLIAAIAADALGAVLANLLQNAARHGGERPTVVVDARAADGRVLISVADDGPGVPEAIASRIFEPLFTTAAGQGGHGLGLAISRALVGAHGGTLNLDSQASGARFVIDLPAAV